MSNMYCRNCGSVIDANSAYCQNCGQDPHAGSNYCPECGHFCIPGDTMCIQCHASLAKQARFSTQISGSQGFGSASGSNASGFVVSGSQPQPQPQPQYQSQSQPQSQSQSQASWAKFLTAGKKYCRNCGLVISSSAHKCEFCNSESGTNYCERCGAATSAYDTVCSVCSSPLRLSGNVGYVPSQPPALRQQPNQQMGDSQPRYSVEASATQSGTSKETAVILCVLGFFGISGIHRLCTGHILSGLLMLFTAGCGGVWTVVDLILILADNFKDGSGRPLRM